MADQFTIRKARSEDASVLWETESLSFPDPWNEADFGKLLSTPGVEGWICWAGTRLSGYVIVRSAGEEAEILNLAVAPEFRRRRYANVEPRLTKNCVPDHWADSANRWGLRSRGGDRIADLSACGWPVYLHGRALGRTRLMGRLADVYTSNP